MSLWLVRGGKLGEQEALALAQGLACIGFREVPDLSQTLSRDEIANLLRQTYPQDSAAATRNFTGQLYAFAHRMHEGDVVAMPLKSQPQIALGRVVGPYTYRRDLGDVHHTRQVEWVRPDIPRTQFAQDVLSSLGALMTVCQIERNNAEERVRTILEGKPDPASPSIAQVVEQVTGNAEETDALTDIEQLARDQILGYIEQHFKGHALARLVDAVLQAEGYVTYMSPPGPDGGADVLAGGGSLGLDRPRLCVQVKSSQTPCDVTIFRALQGTMQTVQADQGLLVSWGGFTRAVEAEARTRFFSVRLWNADDVIKAVLRNYEKLPEALRGELPLKRMWALVLDD
jgi:restriction system protein